MKQQIILPGQGKSYDWSKDHIFVKSTLDLSDGRLTLVEDRLKPGFSLARHHHRKMIEIFYVLDGAVEFIFDDESVVATPGTTLILTLSDARFLRTSLAQLIEADAAEQAGALCVSDFREA